MQCELKNRERYIADYVTGTLREEEQSRFEKHYFQCKQCFMEVQAVVDAASMISVEGSKFTAQNIRQIKGMLNVFRLPASGRGIKWAAAFTGAALIIVIIFLLNNNTFNTKDVVTTEEEIYTDPDISYNGSKPDADSDLADMTGPSFEPSVYMEEWITETQRSEDGELKVISPTQGKIFSDEPVSFTWQASAANEVYLKVMNNHEEEIYFVKTPGSEKHNILANEGVFPGSGLYYWRIENEEEVLYTGKFYFLKSDK